MRVDAPALRTLAAALREEVRLIRRCTQEFGAAERALQAGADTLTIYGAAALLESAYTGAEKAMLRIARVLGAVPSGDSWHRDLLRSMTLDIERERPAVLSRSTAAGLDPYLAFRHRFRNLYVFDLDIAPMISLLQRGSSAFDVACTELLAFAERVQRWARELDNPEA